MPLKLIREMAGEMDEDPGKNGHKNQEMESIRKHW